MEAIAVVGLVASVASIGDVVSKVIRTLCHVQTKYKNANLTVSLIVGQLSTLNAAFNQISEWISTSLRDVPHNKQLIDDLTVAVDSCKVLMLVLDQRFSNLDKENDGRLSTTGNAVFLWREGDLKEYLSHLGNQIAALNFLLTALQCRSLSEQSALLKSSDGRQAISLVQDDTSSLLMIKDSESCYSVVTETSEQLDAIFDFDQEVVNSRAYQMAMRSHVRQVIAPSNGVAVQVKQGINEHNNVGEFMAPRVESLDVYYLAKYRPPITEQNAHLNRMASMSGRVQDFKEITIYAPLLAFFRVASYERYPDGDPPLWAKGTLLIPEEQRLKAQSDLETREEKSSVDEDEENSIQITRFERRHASVMVQLIAKLQGGNVTWELNMTGAWKPSRLLAVVVHISNELALVGWIRACEIGLHKTLSTIFVTDPHWIKNHIRVLTADLYLPWNCTTKPSK